MEKETLRKKIFAKINNLPTLPVVIPKLLSLLEDKETRAEQIVDTVSHDPALASKILQVANSAYYGFPQEISSLERAIALLGFNMVKSLALSIGVIRTLPAQRTNQLFSFEDLWIHSLAVATLMRQIGHQVKGEKEDGDALFIIGLLHDVGKILLDQFFPDEFSEVLALVERDNALPFFRAELMTIGIDHGEAGALLLKRWKFPEVIVQPIYLHHQQVAEKGAGSHDLAILKISDLLAQKAGVGKSGNLFIQPYSEADLSLLGFEEPDLEESARFLEEAKEGIFDFYKAMR